MRTIAASRRFTGPTLAGLVLVPGSDAVDLGCEPGSGDDRPCSATSSPDGTLTGVRTTTFTSRVTYPFGEQCARLITANLVLDAGGLRQA